MTYEEYKRELKAKSIRKREVMKISNKKLMSPSEYADFATKRAKNVQNAEKTAEIGQKLREKAERDYQKHYGKPKNGPVSVPNPNSAFRRKKGKERVSVWSQWYKTGNIKVELEDEDDTEEENYVHDEDNVLNDMHDNWNEDGDEDR